MKNTIFAAILLLLFISPVVAQDRSKSKPIEVVAELKVNPEPYSVSHNVIFLVDASSSINRNKYAVAKFNAAWKIITNEIVSDHIYFRTYVFHDKGMFNRTKWAEGSPRDLKKSYKWIKNNTGIYSWGLEALVAALRDKNPLDKNPASQKRLTIVLITDGGFTEASDKDENGRTGSFKVLDRAIATTQASREKDGLEPATIVAIGLENKAADITYGTSVKRPDKECQAWLAKIGKKYKGGYFFVKVKNEVLPKEDDFPSFGDD